MFLGSAFLFFIFFAFASPSSPPPSSASASISSSSPSSSPSSPSSSPSSSFCCLLFSLFVADCGLLLLEKGKHPIHLHESMRCFEANALSLLPLSI